jgi:hypothetical protein
MIQIAVIIFVLCYLLFPNSRTQRETVTVTPAPIEQSVTYGPDGCNVNVVSKLETEHKVGPITNLKEDRFEFGARNECTVNYDIVVDGEQHHVDQTETGLEQMNSICYYARERGRKDLLLSLGGKFNSHANINCRYRETIGKIDN